MKKLGTGESVVLRWADGEEERIGTLPEEKPVVYVEYLSAEGRPYYWNSATGKTQWERPTEAPVISPMQRVSSKQFGPPGCNLFVFHLPNEWTENDLVNNFAPFGNVVSARIMTEKETGRSRGFGFVSFDVQASALNALKAMNGYQILGKRLKVQFKKGEFSPDIAS